MEKEFVPYKLAVKLKALGFDEPCLGFYNHQGQLILMAQENENVIATYKNSDVKIGMQYAAPTYSQAFRWFREKYELSSWVYNSHMDKYFYTILQDGRIVKANESTTTYEETELACLKKLIEIVEQTNAEMTEHGVYK